MTQTKNVRVALVVPHIFLHKDILPNVIFSPGALAIELARGLNAQNIDVTLFSPGPIQEGGFKKIHADMSYFEKELAQRKDTYIDLLKKHPFTFVSLARQVQSEIIAKAYEAANDDEFDVVHIYTNEEDIALPFAKLCTKPVVFTHHDPYNFMVKYKSVFPKYTRLPWISLSYAQRIDMPLNTHWIGNTYHGLNSHTFQPFTQTDDQTYIAYLGRIIEPKGVHLAIDAVNLYNQTATIPLTLKIAGKHYGEAKNDTYWQNEIVPKLSQYIEYVGFIQEDKKKNEFLGNAKALIIPSIFNEPFGMVSIEALASGTPVIALDSGALPEIITPKTGRLVKQSVHSNITIKRLSKALYDIDQIDRSECRKNFENRFTLERMCSDHAAIYRKLIG